MRLLYKVKGSPIYLEEFNVDIYINDYDTLFFRLNLYTLKEGVPLENLLQAPLYVQFTGKKGKASTDLKSYNIVLDDGFVISLEYVKN